MPISTDTYFFQHPVYGGWHTEDTLAKVQAVYDALTVEWPKNRKPPMVYKATLLNVSVETVTETIPTTYQRIVIKEN